MDCEQTKRLLAPYVLGDLDNDPQRCSQLQAHLLRCPECAEMYEGFQETIGFVLDHKAEFAQAFKKARAIEEENAVPSAFPGKLSNNRSLFVRISAIAACLALGFGLFFAVNQLNKAHYGSSPITSIPQQNPLKIELITGDATEIIPNGQLITASNDVQTLRINDNRQMVLNVDTQLSIEPYSLGCVVKLDKGEIYVEVGHDGKPFIVKTSHGRAVITGTTFNIKADHDKMDLAVVEGSVKFESEKGAVRVTGGCQSSIAERMEPSTPVVCDVIQITQWAKKQDRVESVQISMSKKTDFPELAELPLSFIPYCDPEDINFDVWIDQHRVWFEREFPWTKRLQKLLAQDEIQINAIDLLVESDDLWRFTWPEHCRQRILADDQNIIKNITSQYDVEVNRLVSTESLTSAKKVSSIEAFERWLNEFEQGKNDLIIDSIHAATFLINTRSLAWYAIETGKVQIQDKQQALDLLTEQVKAASNTLEMLNRLLIIDKQKTVCSEIQYDEHIEKLEDEISAMMDIEKELVGHEISNQ